MKLQSFSRVKSNDAVSSPLRIAAVSEHRRKIVKKLALPAQIIIDGGRQLDLLGRNTSDIEVLGNRRSGFLIEKKTP